MTQRKGVDGFCLDVPVALCLLVITHKPRGCLGNLVNHLRKEKQTSLCLVLLVFLRSVLEEGEQSETMLLSKQCLERCPFYIVALFISIPSVPNL